MATAEIKISIDHAANVALINFAQAMWDQHKVRIDSVDFDWLEAVGAEGTTNIALSCKVGASGFAGGGRVKS